MTKISWSRLMFFMTLALVLALAACGGDSAEEDTSTDESGEETTEEESTEEESTEEEDSATGDIYNYEDFEKTVAKTGDPSGEGTLRIGYTSDTPFEGTLNWAFYQGAPDADMLSYFDESVISMDADFQFTNDGAIQYEMNEEDNTVTFTVRDGVTWHDGEPLKISDYVASYEIIGSPDYEGIRGSTDGFTLIEGYNEYRAGEADSISGIEIVDDQTAVFTYTELAPSLTAGGFWFYAFPEHHYDGLEISEMAAAPQTRENPIGIGPYKVDSIVTGESMVLSKFEDYWRGEPGVETVEVRVVPSSSISNAVESGEVDIAANFPTDQYPDVADMEGVEWLANIDGAYTYIGFKLGSWDPEAGSAGRVDYKPEEMKMGDVELRRAMWHAIDNDAIGEQFYNGLRWKATSLITPYHASWHQEVEVPDFNPEEANNILDAAGYEDVDGDGMRETPEGEPLVINFASMSGGDTAEPLAQYYIQSWENVGLDVQLSTGRLIEFNSFYDMVENDDPEIDIYQGAWGVGSDVDPSGLYGPEAPFNYTRYESEENTALLADGNSQEALDVDYRKDVYNQWAELMVEEIPVIPTLYRSLVTPVNERVINYSIDYEWNEDLLWYRVGVEDSE